MLKHIVSVVIFGCGVVACKGMNPIGTAQAQSAGDTAACTQWAFMETSTSELAAGPLVTVKDGQLSSTLAPAGWEPYAVTFNAESESHLFRKCVQ